MKSHRLVTCYRKNASKYHRLVGKFLFSGPFKNNKIYQEYPVNRINSEFPSGREKFDWVICDLQVVIECHGEFHTTPFPWGNRDKAEQALKDQQKRDKLKKAAAVQAGWSYIALDVDELNALTQEKLTTRVLQEVSKYVDKNNFNNRLGAFSPSSSNLLSSPLRNSLCCRDNNKHNKHYSCNFPSDCTSRNCTRGSRDCSGKCAKRCSKGRFKFQKMRQGSYGETLRELRKQERKKEYQKSKEFRKQKALDEKKKE